MAAACPCGKGEESPGFMEAWCQLTAGQGNLTESAAESRPPMDGSPSQARLKGCGKSAPRLW